MAEVTEQPVLVPVEFRRPNGRGVIGTGVGMIVLGLLALVVMWMSSGSLDSSSAMISRRGLVSTIALWLVGTGVPTLLAGLVIHAIWFLPGEERKRD